MSVKIRMFKGLQNGIENPKEFLEELNWIYKREHKADELANDAEKAEYISETWRILFRSNLEGKAELWYSKLPPAIKDNWEALKKEFLDSFEMEDVDKETRLVDLRLELSNLRQREIENIAEFIARTDVLAKEFSNSQVDVSMAVTRGILDLEYKEKLLFECARSKSFTFGNVKTLVKALYFFHGKDNLFDPSYRDLRSVSLPSSSIQSTEELVKQCIPTLVQGVRTLNSTLIHGLSLSSYPTYQQPYSSPQSGRQRQYCDRNLSADRCYICNELGHYAHQCPRRGNQRQPPQQYFGQRYPQPQYKIPHYLPIQYPPPPALQAEQAPEVRTILAPVKNAGSEKIYKGSQSRLMIEYEGDQENESQMVPLAAPAVTQGGGIRKAQKTNKTRPRIDRERLKTLLENETEGL